MRLVTRDKSEGGVFTVLASPLPGDHETAVIAKFGGRDDVARCVDALMAGEVLRFNLGNEQESLVGFDLPNDFAFRKVYDETCRLLTSGDNDEPNPAPDLVEIQRNPKGYAVWLVEDPPGQYGVLLVRLNPARDNLEQAWSVGQFRTRDEQGKAGLEMARDLQIKLMDVVKAR
jgi:hypothetical protein